MYKPLLFALILAFAPIVHAQDDAEQPVDYAALDEAVLAILADNMVIKIGDLDAQLARTEDHVVASSKLLPSPEDGAADASAESPAPPAHASMDKAALVARCEELAAMIADRRSQIDGVKGELSEQYGGEVASVGDKTIYIPEGEWIVTVVENREPDPMPLKEKIATFDSDLAAKKPGLEKAFTDAQKEKSAADAELDSAKTNYDYYHERTTIMRKLKSGHTVEDSEYRWGKTHRSAASRRKKAAEKRFKAAVKTLRTAEKKLELAVKTRDVQVGRLEREIEAMQRAREVVVKLDDGSDATVLATQAFVDEASTMQVDERYVVRGKARFSPGGEEPARITLKEVEPATAPGSGSEVAPDAPTD